MSELASDNLVGITKFEFVATDLFASVGAERVKFVTRCLSHLSTTAAELRTVLRDEAPASPPTVRQKPSEAAPLGVSSKGKDRLRERLTRGLRLLHKYVVAVDVMRSQSRRAPVLSGSANGALNRSSAGVNFATPTNSAWGAAWKGGSKFVSAGLSNAGTAETAAAIMANFNNVAAATGAQNQAEASQGMSRQGAAASLNLQLPAWQSTTPAPAQLHLKVSLQKLGPLEYTMMPTDTIGQLRAAIAKSRDEKIKLRLVVPVMSEEGGSAESMNSGLTDLSGLRLYFRGQELKNDAEILGKAKFGSSEVNPVLAN